jgi:hypothetical protein
MGHNRRGGHGMASRGRAVGPSGGRGRHVADVLWVERKADAREGRRGRPNFCLDFVLFRVDREWWSPSTFGHDVLPLDF